MGRNARKRISYVLPLAKSAGGHRLGVNGLAIDPTNSILYSGGRDGVICAWDLNLDFDPFSDDHGLSLNNEPPKKPPATVFRQQVQAHTHWINDIVLAQQNEALVSASSDITVKIWRPAAQDVVPPQTIGLHSDYVKCLASPGGHANWVASGGLDRKINLWDLNGAGKQLEIKVGEDDNSAKGSVYALAVNDSIVAGGGPESIVRLWDSRSGKRITKFVGHTDNIRDVLMTEDGDTILSASSDQTVKVWSLAAGRCMYTLTMHNDSIWSLYSSHPDLSVFYSSDRSGLVAKTDVRGCLEMDQGLSVAVCQEHEGVNTVVQAGDYVWTSTSSSSINRWLDVNTTNAEVQVPESFKFPQNHRSSVATTRSRYPSPPQHGPGSPRENGSGGNLIPFKNVLRLSNAAPYPVFHGRDVETTTTHSTINTRKPSEMLLESETGISVPFRDLPDFTIEGQNGLTKHMLLNDRRRVLTLDTAGEVTLWDLLQCRPIKSFGKRHMEDVAPEVNTTETVAHWCTVDTRTGSLTCVLEENYCFDAEMYADELHLEEKIDFREDQRINLGKWILRYLFASLIDEEIKRDEAFRAQVLQGKSSQGLQRSNAPSGIALPQEQISSWTDPQAGPESATTLKATNGIHLTAQTPGLSIGLATPAINSPPQQTHFAGSLPPTAEEGTNLEKTFSGQTQNQRQSLDRQSDYFSRSTNPAAAATTPGVAAAEATNGDGSPGPQSPGNEKDTPSKEGSRFGRFGKMSFGMKKLGKTVSNTGTSSEKPAQPPITESNEDTASNSDSRSSKTDDRPVQDNLFGVVQRMRYTYEDQVNQENASQLQSLIMPSLPSETPVLKPPLQTTILIQEDRPDSGGVADLLEANVSDVGSKGDIVEKVAPTWLGEVLLRNSIPPKDIVKVSFILEPYQPVPLSPNSRNPFAAAMHPALPSIAGPDNNNRLNANRMLRARKILSYVAERVEPQPEEGSPEAENAMRPEEYLELLCNGQVVPPTMTLATIRAHVWRGGGDVLLYYRANGRKKIGYAKGPEGPSMSEETVVAGTEGGAA